MCNVCHVDIIDELRNPTDKRRFTDSNAPEGPWLLLGGNGSGAIHAWNTLNIPEPNMREGFDNRGYRLNRVEATKVRSYLEILFKWFLPDLFNYLREHVIFHQIRRGENQPLVDEDGVRHLCCPIIKKSKGQTVKRDPLSSIVCCSSGNV